MNLGREEIYGLSDEGLARALRQAVQDAPHVILAQELEELEEV